MIFVWQFPHNARRQLHGLLQVLNHVPDLIILPPAHSVCHPGHCFQNISFIQNPEPIIPTCCMIELLLKPGYNTIVHSHISVRAFALPPSQRVSLFLWGSQQSQCSWDRSSFRMFRPKASQGEGSLECLYLPLQAPFSVAWHRSPCHCMKPCTCVRSHNPLSTLASNSPLENPPVS